MRCPYYPYFPVVLDILHSRAAEQVLDAPCGTGWLGDNLHATARRSVELDGVGLWEFPEAGGGYREVIEHDLETPLSLNRQYDAAVCCEAIHLVTNPGVLVESLRRAAAGRHRGHHHAQHLVLPLAPAVPAARHSGFRPMVGRQRGQDYITYFPWSYPQLHLLLSHYGYVDITLHEVDEVKPKRMLEHLLALPSRLYYRQRIKRAESEEARQFWREAARDQSVHGRWLVVSARRPVEDMAA